jgi:N4-(beta-N-acetylglucosaminyl)-L-asparaginase
MRPPLPPLSRRQLLGLALSAPLGLCAGGAAAQTPAPGENAVDEATSGGPAVVSTWSFGLPANARAWERLMAADEALTAVVEGVAVCERDPGVTTVGLGSYPNSAGVVQLDASVMDGTTRRCGAVAALERVATAAAVARRVMDATPHVLLAGDGALAFAREQGFEEVDLLTDEMRRRWETRRAGEAGEPPAGPSDTIGMLALDADGAMAGACTTSGLAWKLPGRVGDSPLIGAGLYVDGTVGGATATGVGEEIIRVCGAFLIVELMRQGWEPERACAEACDRIARNHGGASTTPAAAFLALRRDGVVGACAVHAGYFQYAQSEAATGHRLLAAPGRI